MNCTFENSRVNSVLEHSGQRSIGQCSVRRRFSMDKAYNVKAQLKDVDRLSKLVRDAQALCLGQINEIVSQSKENLMKQQRLDDTNALFDQYSPLCPDFFVEDDH
uniref:Uncharacterized protein n=2 Tax=Spongospora subterranea TaxID=70186 RepID=A0A0H5R4X6_9EUKA|eukprot:CRZ03159.1 hypothetical protein [Spongospora subterranea]